MTTPDDLDLSPIQLHCLHHSHGHRPQTSQSQHHRRARPGSGARHVQSHRLHRRRPRQAADRRRQHLDRDHALQLPPAPPLGQGERRHSRRRRHADGVQHHRHLRRRDHGHRGHEGVAGEPRGDCRLHRTGLPRTALRRRGLHRRLRQDDPRRRHGARAHEPARPRALRRNDCRRQIQRQRRNHSGCVRGRRRECRRQDERRRSAGARKRSVSRSRRMRRPVHREHDVAR